MTSRAPERPERLGLTPRRRVVIGLAVFLAWSVQQAGVRDVVNTRGWSSFARFWRAALSPESSGEFLRLTADAATVTLAYAVLGSLLSLVLGALAAGFVSEVVSGRGVAWRVARVVLTIPRAVHEILWALLLVQVFGFDPLVAIIAIGVPFGAVTAKVFGETLDEADRRPFDVLRAAGAGRATAMLYGIVPQVRGEVLSYAFYRFECAIRSAAVLGVIGAGGLGFQLDLSFESLRYSEIWTLVAALMLLSGVVESWSTMVRRGRRFAVGRNSLLLVALLVPLSVYWSGLRPQVLWSARTRELAGRLVERMFPSRLGPGGWSELIEATLDTVAMSVLATTLAAAVGLGLAIISRRRRSSGIEPGRAVVRLAMLLARAVPAPVWAFLLVLVLFPGIWPGVAGLAVYNVGVLGRLFTEVLEETDARPAAALTAIGAPPASGFLYGVLPAAGPRLVSLVFYRWEVIVRETVVVGVVGAGGLGQLINEHLAARDFAAVTGALGAMLVIAMIIDALSAAVRRTLR